MKLIHNTGADRVIDLIRPHLKRGNQLGCVTPSFSLYAFAEMREVLSVFDRIQLILSPDEGPLEFLGAEGQRAARNRLQARWLANQCAKWIGGKVDLRRALGPVPEGAVVMRKPDATPEPVVLGSLAFGTAGLGLTKGNPLSLIQASESADEAAQPRRFICVQLPEPLDPADKTEKAGAALCDKLSKPRTIAELTKERLRRAAAKVKANPPLFAGDTGFRVFKLDHSNIRDWNPNPADLEASLFDHQDHLLEGRSEADVLYELLLKLGLDLCVPIELRSIEGHEVHAVGGGVLMTCLAEQITREQVEPLAQGMIDWHKELVPAGDTTCVFRDSAFADDVAKTNLAAILEQHGIQNVRSL